jgi:hypothetical protein
MKRKIGIMIFILITLFIGATFIASASANDSTAISSEDEVSGIDESESQDIKPLDFGTQTLEDLENDPNVVAIKGQIPQYDTQAERENWLDKLDTTYNLIWDSMSPYTYPQGPVLAYGLNFDGYIEVVLYKGANITDSQIDEIYNVISKKASEASVQDVPVVFGKSDFFQDDVESGDVGSVEETSNLSTSEEKNDVELNNSNNNYSDNSSSSGEGKSSAIRYIPGFELLGSLTCLYVGWKLRRKE